MNDLDDLLRQSAPRVNVGVCADAMEAMVQEIATTQRRPWLGSRPRRWAAAAIAASVFVPTAALAVQFASQTGQFGKPGYTENDTTEYINMCGSDINAYVATLEPQELALPTGVTWAAIRQDLLTAAQVSCPPRDNGATMQVTGIKVGYMARNGCAWEKDLLDATGAGAPQERHEAGAAIARAEQAIAALGASQDDPARRQRFEQGDTTFIAYDYQVNCLGHNTAANPPNVPAPR